MHLRSLENVFFSKISLLAISKLLSVAEQVDLSITTFLSWVTINFPSCVARKSIVNL